MRILGLDEAGRGSVLGPLVVGGFLWEAPDGCGLRDVAAQQPLRDIGADDSKGIRPLRRQEIRLALEPLGSGLLHLVRAPAIDQANLNRLEEQAFVALILQTRPHRVYLDAPCHPRGIARLQQRLVSAVARGGHDVREWVVEPKADSTWPVVGAASIFAKTTRDAEMRALCEQHGEDLGSGYPSDPASRRWIARFLASDQPLPACVRSRWGTIDKLRQQRLF